MKHNISPLHSRESHLCLLRNGSRIVMLALQICFGRRLGHRGKKKVFRAASLLFVLGRTNRPAGSHRQSGRATWIAARSQADSIVLRVLSCPVKAPAKACSWWRAQNRERPRRVEKAAASSKVSCWLQILDSNNLSTELSPLKASEVKNKCRRGIGASSSMPRRRFIRRSSPALQTQLRHANWPGEIMHPIQALH